MRATAFRVARFHARWHCPTLHRTVMDDSQIELLTKKERLLEAEITQLRDTGLTAQVASKQADLDEIRADLKKQYREIW